MWGPQPLSGKRATENEKLPLANWKGWGIDEVLLPVMMSGPRTRGARSKNSRSVWLAMPRSLSWEPFTEALPTAVSKSLPLNWKPSAEVELLEKAMLRRVPAARSASVGTWTGWLLSLTKRMIEVSEVTEMDWGL